MSNLFDQGDENFRILISVDASKSSPWLYGEFEFRIGDIHVHSGSYHNLEDVAQSFFRLARANGSRDSSQLFSADPEKIVRWARSVLYEEEVQPFAWGSEVERFNLMFHPALGSQWLMMVCHEDRAKIIYADDLFKSISVRVTSKLTAEKAITDACEFLVSRIQQLHS